MELVSMELRWLDDFIASMKVSLITALHSRAIRNGIFHFRSAYIV